MAQEVTYQSFPLPAPVPTLTVPTATNTTSQKVTIGVVIVLLSIFAIIVIALVTWYFIQDPWEYPKDERSSIHKNYYKDQFSYYAWSALHQSPYILLHIYSPRGTLKYVPQSVMTWPMKQNDLKMKQYNPIFELYCENMTDMIGLSRLRKKGVLVNSHQILMQWKKENFFPLPKRKTVDPLHVNVNFLPKEIKNEIEFDCNFNSIPTASLLCRYQPGDNTTEETLSGRIKILSCSQEGNDVVTGSISFYIVFLIENKNQTSTLDSLIRNSNLNSTVPTCDQIELSIYNPEWAEIVFAGNHLQIPQYIWNE